MLMYLSILDTQDEKDKFTEVYEQYQHFCWYVAFQLLGDDHLAEDAVQETFLALTDIWTRLKLWRVPEPGSF